MSDIIKISPSILSADFSKLGDEVISLEKAGADLVRVSCPDENSTKSLKEIVKGLKEDLKTHSKNLQDKVVKIKMSEAIKSINKFCGIDDKSDVVKDEYVIQTMRYLELVKEVKKSGNKKQKVI